MPEVVNAGNLPGIGLAMVPSFGIKKHKGARNLVVVPEAQPGADSAPRYIFIPILDEVFQASSASRRYIRDSSGPRVSEKQR